MSLHLFAGLRVRDFQAARPWYERLLGEVTFLPHATEAVWTLAEDRSVYIVEHADGAGHSVATVMVDDLDAHVAAIAARGLEPDERLTYSNGVRRCSTATRTATRWASEARRSIAVHSPNRPPAYGYPHFLPTWQPHAGHRPARPPRAASTATFGSCPGRPSRHELLAPPHQPAPAPSPRAPRRSGDHPRRAGESPVRGWGERMIARRSGHEVRRLIDRLKRLVAERGRLDGGARRERLEATGREIARLQRRLALQVKRDLAP